MNITFIIGNGFDINLNLKTSYKNFYEYYLEKYKNNKKDKDIQFLCEQFSNAKENKLDYWKDFEVELGNITEHYEKEDDFINVYEHLKIELNSYLKNEENKIDYSKINEEIVNKFKDYSTNFNNYMNEEWKLRLKILLKTMQIVIVYIILLRLITLHH